MSGPSDTMVHVSFPYSAPVSQTLFDRAAAVTPGGVNSPVRAFRAVGGTPRFMVSGTGPYLTDADGREYVITTSPGHPTPAPWAGIHRPPSAGPARPTDRATGRTALRAGGAGLLGL